MLLKGRADWLLVLDTLTQKATGESHCRRALPRA